MRILLVEDDRTFAEDLLILLPSDFHVEWVQNSSTALTNLRERENPDAILLDVNLPADLSPWDEMEGLALLDVIEQEFPRIPVVLLTGQPRERLEQARQGRPLPTYLEKPCTVETLVDVLHSFQPPSKD